jgi:CRP-like cAMP-binding protein
MARQFETKNRLLQLLSAKTLDGLAKDLIPVDLPPGLSLVSPDEPIRHITFLESGIASMIVEDRSGRKIELRHVGHEGLVGYPALLGVDRTPYRTLIQTAGHGYRIEAQKVVDLLNDPEVRTILLRYVYSSELQISFTTLSAARYTLPERLARWLLMCQDRIEGESLTLTHDSLSLMLGVRRASVTDQLHVLEGTRAIRATRGHIRILNRDMLLRIAGPSYGTPETEYERLVMGLGQDDMPENGERDDTVPSLSVNPLFEMR